MDLRSAALDPNEALTTLRRFIHRVSGDFSTAFEARAIATVTQQQTNDVILPVPS